MKQHSYVTMNVAKSMLVMFTMLLMLFAVQSCQTDGINVLDRVTALKNFEVLLNENACEIQKIADRQQIIDNQTKSNTAKEVAQNKLNNDARKVLKPLIKSSKELLSFYSINNEDLIVEFGSSDDSRIVLAGVIMFVVEKAVKENIRVNSTISISNITQRSSSFVTGFTEIGCQGISMGVFPSAKEACNAGAKSYLTQEGVCTNCSEVNNGWTTDNVIACLGVALGLNELWGLIDNTAQLATVQGTTKLLKLLAKRYLGWAGVAVAIYSFGDCMEIW